MHHPHRICQVILVCTAGRANVCHQGELDFPSCASVRSPLISVEVTYMQRDYSAFPKGRSTRKWPFHKPAPAPKFSPGHVAALLYSLFKHLVAQSVHLIKWEISFPPVGSASIHLSQSTYRGRFGRRCLFLFPPTSLHLSRLENTLCGQGISWLRWCQVSPCCSQNVSIGELLACSVQKAGHSSQVL